MTGGWWARGGIAGTALLLAALTGAAGAAFGAPGWAGAYVSATLVALVSPTAVAAQVICGQVLLVRLLLGDNGPSPVSLLPMLAAVVATSELLGAAARLDAPVARAPSGDLRRAGRATVIAGGVFGWVLFVGGLPGPSGLFAIALGSAACVALAVLLGRKAE